MRGLFFTGIAAACCALLSFGGCSNLLETKSNETNSKTETTDSTKGSVQIMLGSQARYIPAAEYDLTSVDEWTVELYEQSKESGSYASSAAYTLSLSDGSSSAASVPFLERSDNGKSLAVTNIPAGTYRITIQGSYTLKSDTGDTKIIVTGTASGVEIAQGKNTAVTIFVGLKKEENGSGGLSLTLTNADASNYFSELVSATATLTSRSSSGTTYSTSDKSLSLSTDNGYVLSADTIKSGWYTLSIEHEGYRVSLSDTEIEIADGIVTTGTIEIMVTRDLYKAYYATNDTSASGNGLSSVSRINLTNLLKNFGASFRRKAVSIYVDGDPEISLYALSLVEEKMAAKGNGDKIVMIYNASSSPALNIYLSSSEPTESGTQTYTAVSDISGAITVTADKDADGNEYKTLAAGYITVESSSSYTVTLKDGAALSIASGVSGNLTGTLGICAIKEDENGNITDNFGAYITAPFITSTSAIDISNNIALYDKDGNEAKYRLITTQAASGYEYMVTDRYSVALSTVSAYSDIETSGKITYTVSSEAELNLLASLCNTSNESAPFDGVTIVLESDLALSNDETNPFTPIGTYLNTFAGTFDGQSHKISNLYISSSDNAGLFAVLNGGAIRNLTVEGTVFSSEGSSATKYGTGGIVGYALDTAIIENCVANVTIKGDDRANVGGICGLAAGGAVIRNCVNVGNITSSVGYTGGIAGKAEVSGSKTPAIYNCANFGEIRGTGNVGGIAGSTPGDVAVCFNEGRVYGNTRGSVAAIANASGTEANYYTGCYYYSHSYSSYSSYSYSFYASQGFVSGASTDSATGIDTSSLSSLASLLTTAAQSSSYSENCNSWDKTLSNETYSGNSYSWPVCVDCGNGFTEYDLTASGKVALKIYSRTELDRASSALSSGESFDLVISQTLNIENNFTSIPAGATVTINRNSGFNGLMLNVTDNVSVGATSVSDAAGRGTLVLDGGSIASDDPLAGSHGGLYCNVVFKNANCNYRGGAVKGGESNNLRFYNCTFENCYSKSYGGAVCILGDSSHSDPQGIVNCTFTNCTAGRYGGAIYCEAANANRSVYITNCTFTGCTATTSGNNIYATGAATDWACSLYYSDTETAATTAERGTSSSPVTK